jgi:hypothetical protein
MYKLTILSLFVLLSLSLSAQKTFKDSLAIRFSFTCPDNYDIVRQPDGSVQIVSPLSGADDTYRESIQISISKAPTGMGIDSLAAYIKRSMLQSVKSVIKPADVREVPVRISGIEGRRVSMSPMVNYNLVTTSESFVITRGGVLRVSYMNQYHGESQTMPMFEKIFASIKID